MKGISLDALQILEPSVTVLLFILRKRILLPMILVPYNPVLSAACLGHWQLNQFPPHQASLEKPSRIKSKTCERVNGPFYMVSGHL